MMYLRNSLLLALLIFFSTTSIGFGQDKSSSSLSYLALGDSYTIGESVNGDQRWPVQLVEALRDSGLQISDPEIIAKTGWTTTDLKKAIADAGLNPPYDLVSLLIGVNDQYRGYEIKDYPKNFRYLLQKAISLAGDNPRHVLVLSIPDYGVTPFGQEKNPTKIAQEISRYNAINKSIADSLGVHYVDITPISKEAENNTSLLASDQLHPSGKMYHRWVEKTVPAILSQFKE